jgi:alpha-L-rhamnosidase
MMKKIGVVLFALVFLGTAGLEAQLPPELLKYLWSAEWITAADAPQRDESVLHFRKIFDLQQVPQHFVIHVSADNQYLFFVNQKRAGTGPNRGDLAHWKYETYDIAPLLRTGRNVLAATVWNFGVRTPLAQISDRTAFVLHGDTAAERSADTNASWEVEQEKGFVTLPTPAEVLKFYYVAEPATRTDGRTFDWGWNSDSNASGLWKKATPIEHASIEGGSLQNDNWQLVADSLPPMQEEWRPAGRVVRATGIEEPTSFPGEAFTVPENSKVSVLVDNTTLTTGYPELTISGGKGAVARLTYAEALVDGKGEKGNRNEIAGKHIAGIFDEFVADGSDTRAFLPLGWKTWRYLQLDVNTAGQPLRVDGLRVLFTAYPFEERAYFRSDDEGLRPIWDVGWRTARLDAHDTYMDTPYWERMQYIGDTRIQALISYAVAGDDRLARQAIQAFNNSRISEGVTRSRHPSSVRQIIPTFSLLWVGMVHDFWMYRSDSEFVKAQLFGTRTVLDWFLQRQRADGLVGNVPWWPFVDWGSDFGFGIPPLDGNGGSSIITLQLVEALRYATELEKAYGDPARVESYRKAADRATEAVRILCWNKKYGLFADTPAQTHFSQHANILAAWLDVVAHAEQKEFLNRILSASDSGFAPKSPLPTMTKATYYFRFYLARALEHAGMGDEYLKLLDPWRQMVSLGLTTWAEQPEPTRSDSHAWSAHPNYDLLTIVAGIRPKSPGFAAVTVEPHLGALKQVSSAVPHAKGMIETEYKRTSDGVKAQITLPGGLSGDFVWQGKTIVLHEGKQELQLK